MKISQSFQELLHVAFDLGFVEANVGIGEHAAQIVVGIRRHHVESGALLALAALLVRCEAISQHFTQRYRFSVWMPYQPVSQQPFPLASKYSDG